MTETSLRIKIDGVSQAQSQARVLESGLDGLSRSGTGAASSVDRLDAELRTASAGMSAAAQRTQALIASQDRLAAAARGSEAAITALTADVRSQAEAQRVLAQAITAANERAAQQTRVQQDLARRLDATADRTDELGAAQRRASASSIGFGQSLSSLSSVVGGIGLGAAITSSVQLAIEFERLDLRFQTVFGSARSAGREMAFVRGEADRLGVEVSALAAQYSALSAASLGTTLEGQKTRDIFSAVAEASGKLGLSTEQTSGALTAIQQIMSKGTVQAEELRGQLGERLPGAFQVAARAMGVTTAELGKLLEQGAVASDVFLPKFAAELRRTFGTDATTQIDSATASFSRLRSEIQLVAAASAQVPTDLLAGLSDYIATLLQYEREGGPSEVIQSAFAPFVDSVIGVSNFVTRSNVRGIGDRARTTNEQRAFVEANPFTPQIDPFAPVISSQFRAVPQPTGPTGPGILSEGVPQVDQRALNELLARSVELRQQLAGATNVQRVQESILSGELRGQNVVVQQQALANARLQDAIAEKGRTARDTSTAERATSRAALDVDRERQEALRDSIAQEQQLLGLLESVLTPAERFRRELAQINQLANDGSLADVARRLNTTPEDVRNRLVTQAGERLPRGVEDVEPEVKSSLERLSVFSDQAARNIQSSLADAIVTGFDDGIGGAALSFTRFLQRAAAEAAAAEITNGLLGERKDGEKSDGGLIGKAGSFLSGLFGGEQGPTLTAGASAPIPVTLVGPGGIGGSVFGAPASPFGGGLGSSLLGSAGIGGSLFGAGSDETAGLSGAIGSDLIASFEKLTSASTAFGAANAQVFGDSTSLAANLGQSLLSGPGAAFTDASSLASSFFSSQAAGIASTTAASTAAAATTAATATATNTAIAASAAPAAALTSIASFGGAALAAAAAIPLVTTAISALIGGFAEGGRVTGPGTGTSDSILAKLSRGEFVLPAAAADRIGERALESLRRGDTDAAARLLSGDDADPLPAFARGGRVGQLPMLEMGGFAPEAPEQMFMDRPGTVRPGDFDLSALQARSEPITVMAPPVTVTNIVVESEEAARRYSKSAEAQADTLNTIRLNRSAVQAALR